MNNKIIITKVGEESSEGITLTFNKPVVIGNGMASITWRLSWDKIGEALFGDDYASGSVDELTKFRNN